MSDCEVVLGPQYQFQEVEAQSASVWEGSLALCLGVEDVHGDPHCTPSPDKMVVMVVASMALHLLDNQELDLH